jgi:hypothetical protein
MTTVGPEHLTRRIGQRYGFREDDVPHADPFSGLL